MPTDIGVEELRRLMAASQRQLIEVLPREEYEEEHLAGSINIPLKDLDIDAVRGLDRTRPVVVYCWDDA